MAKFILKHKIEILIAIFSAGWFLFFSRYGIDIDDEGFHLYVSNMILKGFVPYKDFILHVTPLSFYLQAVIFRIFNPSLIIGRLTVAFLGLYVALILFRITKKIIHSDYFAAIASVIFIFWGVPQIRHPWYGWYGLASGLTFLYFYLKHLESQYTVYLFFTGLFCGLTFLMKQNLGMACLASYGAFLLIGRDGIKFYDFLKRQCVFIMGILTAMAPFVIYFTAYKALPAFLYYVFRFATFSAGGRLIFNPFPHVKLISVIILSVFLLLAWLLYNCFWGGQARKKIFLSVFIFFTGVLLVMMILFIMEINDVDNIYILDHIKMGAVNGFFNLAMLAVLIGIFFMFKKDKKFMFITLFAIFYIWASLCISRDHLHLVLGMPPSYILLAFMFYAVTQRARNFLIRKNKDSALAGRYANFSFCVFPLIFISWFGFFTTLKNEGFRSISPPIVNMHSELNIPRAKGIIVTKEDKDTIEGITGYIRSNTKEGERIFDTYKSSLFYFLSDRVHPSFYYILHSDLFRPDKQGYVINDIIRYNIKLAITGRDMWDNLEKYTDEKRNPLTFKVLGYMRDNFKVEKQFGRYYILIRKI